MEFFICGMTAKSKGLLKSEIQKLGGKVVSKIHDKLAAVIATPGKFCTFSFFPICLHSLFFNFVKNTVDLNS